MITETDPMGHSAMAKNESLYDGIRVISQYADVLVLRHGDSEQVPVSYTHLRFPSASGWLLMTIPLEGICWNLDTGGFFNG